MKKGSRYVEPLERNGHTYSSRVRNIKDVFDGTK